MNAKAKAKTPSVAKYADPKSGKTWSGFGRAPGWIAGAEKNCDAFLVGKSAPAESVAKAPAAAKKAPAKTAKAAAKKVVVAVKKASIVKAAPATAKRKPAAKKAATEKSAPKAAALKRAAAAPVEPNATPTT